MAGPALCRRAVVAVASVAVCAGLVGCSGDPEEPSAAATTAASTPAGPDDRGGSDEPAAPQEPALPAAAEGQSLRSAKAFVGYYIDLLNYAMVTGDTTAFRAAAAEGCVGCQDYVDLFSGTYDRGGFYRSKGWALDRVLLGAKLDAAVQFTITATASPITFRERAGGQLRRSKTDPIDFSLIIEKGDRSWSVRDFFA